METLINCQLSGLQNSWDLLMLFCLVVDRLLQMHSLKTREKFVAVTEDCMLLGVSVIAVATFILNVRKWEQVKYCSCYNASQIVFVLMSVSMLPITDSTSWISGGKRTEPHHRNLKQKHQWFRSCDVDAHCRKRSPETTTWGCAHSLNTAQ